MIERWPSGYADLRERILRTGRLDAIDGDLLAPPESGDSYQAFYRRRRGEHAYIFFTWDEVRAHEDEQRRLNPYYEAEQREKRRAREAEQTRLWEAEEARRRAEEARRRAEEARRQAEEIAKRERATIAPEIPVELAKAQRFWFYFGLSGEGFMRVRVPTQFTLPVGGSKIDFPMTDLLYVPVSIAKRLIEGNHAEWL